MYDWDRLLISIVEGRDYLRDNMPEGTCGIAHEPFPGDSYIAALNFVSIVLRDAKLQAYLPTRITAEDIFYIYGPVRLLRKILEHRPVNDIGVVKNSFGLISILLKHSNGRK